MSDRSFKLVEISKLNGDFRSSFGKLLGALPDLWSVSAARGRSMLCNQRDRGHHVKRAGLVGETRLGLVTLRLTRAPPVRDVSGPARWWDLGSSA